MRFVPSFLPSWRWLARAGIQEVGDWIPASAGMTEILCGFFIEYLTKISTFLPHFDSVSRLPFDWLRKLKFRNRHWFQSSIEGAKDFVRCNRNLVYPHSDGIIDGVGYGRYDRQKRSLARFFRAVGSFGIVGFDENSFDLRRLEGRRAFVLQDRRNFVQPAFAKNLLLHQRFAEGHINAALGLTFNKQWIEGAAAIVGDPHFVDFDFAGDAIAMQLNNGSRKTVRRRRTHARAFEVARVLGRPIAAGGAEGAVCSFRFRHSFSEGNGAIVKAGAANFTISELQIIDRDFQGFAGGFEEQGFELTASLDRSIASHHSDAARVAAEIHRC